VTASEAPGTHPLYRQSGPAWIRVLLTLTLLLTAAPAGAQAPAGKEGRVAAEASSDSYPAGLDNPDIELEILELRLLPLTLAELEPLADAWLANARAATQAVTDQLVAIEEAGDAATAAMRRQRLELAETRASVFRKYLTVVASFEAKGGDEAKVRVLRAYPAAIGLLGSSRIGFRDLMASWGNWLVSPEGGVQVGLRILVVIGALLVLLIVAKTVKGVSRRLFARVPNLSKLLEGFLTMVVYWLTIAFGLMIVLAALGVNITPLFALVGGASFILAFALQDTLGNLAAGLMIMINRPFDEGDYVTVAGVGGTVKRVSTVSTTVTTPDNQVIVIPNSKVWGDVITNVTASDTRRVDLVFGIDYDDSIEEAQATLEEVIGRHPKVLEDPGPVIRVNALGDSSVDFIVRPWVAAADYWEVYWDLTRQVKEAFDERGISIPFPQTEMRIKGQASASTPLNPGGEST